MTPTAPRWEWRTFGDDLGPVANHIESLTSTGDDESDELYFLSPGGENVKIRDGLLDIKVLRDVDRAGLERWEPVVKAAFPLSAADVGTAFEALRQPLPTLGRDAYTLDELLKELIEPSSAIRAVPVRKRRVRYTIHGCGGEVSDVEAAGRAIQTIAIESEDQGALLAAVTAAGLRERVNTNVPRGLTLLVDDAPPRYAVIDCGTNSVKFSLGERDAGNWTSIVDRAEITRLGEGTADTGIISTDAIERTAAAVNALADEARKLDARAIAAVGTAGLRMAANREEVVQAIDDATGIEVQVISGEEESRLAYQAVRASLPSLGGSIVVFDTGGGSTQLTFGEGAVVRERFSVNVGAVHYTERLGLRNAVSTEVLQQALDDIASDLSRLDDRPAPDVLVGMGGAVTNIVAVKLGLEQYAPDRVQGAELDRAEVDRQIELYRTRDVDARRGIIGLQPKRADVILAGACIVRTVMDKLGRAALTVSDRGLRHGVLLDRFDSPAT